MECLTPEQVVAYLRTGNGEGRAVEAHARECPGCAMELLLAREALRELGAARAARPATSRKILLLRKQSSWVPWTAAAAVLFAAILIFAITVSKPSGTTVVKSPPKRTEVEPKAPDPVPPKPEPKLVIEQPEPEPPKPKPEEPPKVVVLPPKPEPPKPEPRKPEPPAPPDPKPEPKKPDTTPTVVQRFAVAKVTHQVGGAAALVGKTLLAGDTVATGRGEYVAANYDGFGSLYFRENSRVQLDVEGAITLHEGEFFGKVDSGRRLAPVKTPAGEVQIQAELFGIQTTKTATEVSVAEGQVAVGPTVAKGPQMLVLRPGKAPELKPVEPGFAGWIPDKLAAKRFGGWIEGEAFAPLQGFRVMEWDESSQRRAAVQVADQGTAVLKAPLPFKGKHALWLRVRQYVNKPVVIGVHINGQHIADRKLEGEERKPPWRWEGPFQFTADRLELTVVALSRTPLQQDERRSFPVVLDAALVTSDLKFVPERVPEEARAFELILEEPGK